MYDDIGGKIKRWAKSIFIVEAIASVIVAIVMMASAEDGWMFFVGLIALVIGPLLAWVSSWLLYGFGEIIDKLTAIERNTRRSNYETQKEKTSVIHNEADNARIQKIEKLRAQGLITEEEYQQAIFKNR